MLVLTGIIMTNFNPLTRHSLPVFGVIIYEFCLLNIFRNPKYWLDNAAINLLKNRGILSKIT